MSILVRKLRGLGGMGVLSAALWALVGLILATAVLRMNPASIDADWVPLRIAYYFGRAGFVSGVVAGLLVTTAEARRSFGGLHVGRMALWGALGGLAVPWLSAGPRAMLPIFVVLGASTISGALLFARRGATRPEIESRSDTAALRASAG